MKKVLITLGIVFLISIVCLPSFAGPIVSIKLEFGRRSQNCTGFGICIFEINGTFYMNDNSTLGTNEAIGNCSIRENKLEISFENMNAETIKQYFQESHFIMEEDFNLPKEVCEKLNIKTYLIKKGSYPIIRSGKTIKVIY